MHMDRKLAKRTHCESERKQMGNGLLACRSNPAGSQISSTVASNAWGQSGWPVRLYFVRCIRLSNVYVVWKSDLYTHQTTTTLVHAWGPRAVQHSHLPTCKVASNMQDAHMYPYGPESNCLSKRKRPCRRQRTLSITSHCIICYFATLNFGCLLLCHPVSMTGGTVCVYDLWVRWHIGEAHKW
jgi:hypothetical protein